MLLKIQRLSETCRVLEKQYNSAGYDLFPDQTGVINPSEAHIIPLGFATEFDDDHVALVFDRGSVGLKGCGRLAGVIDSDFRGEWKVILARFPITMYEYRLGSDTPFVCCNSQVPFHYSPEKAIAQVLFMPLANVTMEVVAQLGLTERGSKMDGSSDGKKRLGNVIEVGLGMKAYNTDEIDS